MIDDSRLSQAVWRKSSRSGGGEECVEIACLHSTIAVRDSKDPEGPKLAFSPDAWRAFNRAVRLGAFDHHV
jgi:hypothetical protein